MELTIKGEVLHGQQAMDDIVSAVYLCWCYAQTKLCWCPQRSICLHFLGAFRCQQTRNNFYKWAYKVYCRFIDCTKMYTIIYMLSPEIKKYDVLGASLSLRLFISWMKNRRSSKIHIIFIIVYITTSHSLCRMD